MEKLPQWLGYFRGDIVGLAYGPDADFVVINASQQGINIRGPVNRPLKKQQILTVNEREIYLIQPSRRRPRRKNRRHPKAGR